MIYTQQIDTPLGKMIAAANDVGLYMFDFEFRKMMSAIKKRIALYTNDSFEIGHHSLFNVLQQQINEYFEGSRTSFDLPIVYSGTEFQQKVWQALLSIPYGETRTYKDQSIKLGDEGAIRAVARANGENCFAIIVPCHRVVGSNGSLTGYAGGLKAKSWLLQHELKNSNSTYQQTIF